LLIVAKYYCSEDAKASDSVFLNELLHFRGGDGGDSFSLDLLAEVINSHKEILLLTFALENGPKMFIPHATKGKGLRMGVRLMVGFLCAGVNFWHLSHLCTKLMASSLKDGL